MSRGAELSFLRAVGAGLLVAQGRAPHHIPSPAPADARAMLLRAESLRLDALVAMGFRALGLGDDVTDAERRLAAARGRAAFFHFATQEVARRLTSAGVRFAVVKGVVHDELFLGGRGLRGGTDVDVVVADLHGAVRALEDIMVRRPYQEGRPRLISVQDVRDVPVKLAGREIIVDVLGRWFFDPLREDADACLARAQRVAGDASRAFPSPTLEDIAVYVASDAVSDRFAGREKLALDVACLVARDDVDWEIIVDRARRARVAGALWALLDVVARGFGISVPTGTLAALRPRGPRRALVRASAWGAPIAGAFTRAFETDSLSHGLWHFVRYVPSRAVDYLVDEP